MLNAERGEHEILARRAQHVEIQYSQQQVCVCNNSLSSIALNSINILRLSTSTFGTPTFIHSDVWDSYVYPLRRLGLLRLSTPTFGTPTFIHSDDWDSYVHPLRRLGLIRLSIPTFGTPTFIHSDVWDSYVCPGNFEIRLVIIIRD